MGSLPATQELLAFILCILAAGLSLSWYLRLEPLFQKMFELISSKASIFFKFPRRILDPAVTVLPLFRIITLRRFVLRFKFTSFIFFLNVYTFLFTNDLTNGEIDPSVLESRGFSYMHFAHHKWFILMTSNFIHFHLLHLSINMAMLWVLSGSLELLMGARFAALVYLIAMNSNVPNGLFLLPGLKMLYPKLWFETVQYVDVGASLGIMGSLGGLARVLKARLRWLLLGTAVSGTIAGSIYIHNLFGLDHAFSVVIGYWVAHYLLKKKRSQKRLQGLDSNNYLDESTRMTG